MKIPKLSQFNKTHYLILLTVISLFAGLAASLGLATGSSSSLASSNQAQAATPNSYNHFKQNNSKASTQSATKTSSKSNKISKTVRNPFTVSRTPATKATKSRTSKTKGNALNPNPLHSAKTPRQQVSFPIPNFSSSPILRGLLQNGQEQIALIEYQGESKACHIGESIGGYSLVSISGNSIVLQGPQGHLQLQLNQTGRAA